MAIADAIARRAPAVGRVLKAAANKSGSAAGKATGKATQATQNEAANDGGATEQPKKQKGVLATVGRGIAALTAAEQKLSKLASYVPFPGFPALRIYDVSLGQPHPHGHPPNVVGPGPPIPLVGCGPLLPIPYLSGADHVHTGGRSAARCGDMGLGLAPWCGGFFPFFEVWLGSATVWIEGARAARTAVDITLHCTFSAPKPKDPAFASFLGATISGDFEVLIGGVPMPSLVSIAIGGALRLAFKGVATVFKGISAIARHAAPGVVSGLGKASAALKKPFKVLMTPLEHARVRLQARQLLGRRGRIKGSLAYRKQMVQHLYRIRRTQVGRRVLDDIKRSGHPVRIESPSSSPAAHWQHHQYGPSARMDHPGGHAQPQVLPQPSPHGMNHVDANGNQIDALVGPPGPGSGTRVVMEDNVATPTSPTDVVLFHELNHSRNNAMGTNTACYTSKDPTWNADWHNAEEFSTVGQTNLYRQQRNALNPNNQIPLRPNYSTPP